jgi:hypothetical protein
VLDGGFCEDMPSTIECTIPDCNGGFTWCYTPYDCAMLSRCEPAPVGRNEGLDSGVDASDASEDGSVPESGAYEGGVTDSGSDDGDDGDVGAPSDASNDAPDDHGADAVAPDSAAGGGS